MQVDSVPFASFIKAISNHPNHEPQRTQRAQRKYAEGSFLLCVLRRELPWLSAES